MKRKKRKGSVSFTNTLILLGGFILVFLSIFHYTSKSFFETSKTYAVEKNYGTEIYKESSIRNLPSSYFFALAILESSGKKDMPQRFEPHVYKKLKEVQIGTRKQYETITKKTLINMNDNAIRNLATSWGPFQIMGYKCIELGISVSDLRGEHAVYWGIHWIEKTYGKLLRQSRFKDAFHYHNTGKLFPKNGIPKTHDPTYVERGIMYMNEFS